jgi:hypothetical protein
MTPRDFRTQLKEKSRKNRSRLFAPISIDNSEYLLSIQASDKHQSSPTGTHPPEDTEEWEVAIFHKNGRWVSPESDPTLFQDPLWNKYFNENNVAANMPTNVVQCLYDLLCIGNETYYDILNTKGINDSTYQQEPQSSRYLHMAKPNTS